MKNIPGSVLIPSVAAFSLLLIHTQAVAEEGHDDLEGAWALTAGVQADERDARSLFAGLSYALSDSLWLNADVAISRQATPTEEPPIESRSLGTGFDYDFGPVGILVNADYWGDPGELTRNGFVAGLYTSADTMRLSMQAYYRDYTVTARTPDDEGNLSDIREFGMSATGIGAGMRISNDHWFGGLRAAWFEFSRDPMVFQSRAAYRALSLSALTLTNSFIDHRLSGGLGYEFGAASLEFELSTARSAVDNTDIRTAAALFVIPMNDRFDLELNLGTTMSDFENAVFGGVAVTRYGR